MCEYLIATDNVYEYLSGDQMNFMNKSRSTASLLRLCLLGNTRLNRNRSLKLKMVMLLGYWIEILILWEPQKAPSGISGFQALISSYLEKG